MRPSGIGSACRWTIFHAVYLHRKGRVGVDRAVRTALTMEMWDAINGAWLELRNYEGRDLNRDEFTRFLDWVSDLGLELYPAQEEALLEVVTIVRDDGSELVIHAMRMRAKYRRLLPGD